MKYTDLLKILQEFPADLLNHDIAIYSEKNEKYLNVKDYGFADKKVNEVLENRQLFLVIED